MKKILSIFMSIVMLLSITAGLDMSANAEVLTGNCGANGSNVTYSLNTSTGVLTIFGTGKMRNYSSSSNAPWYSNSSSIKTVSVNSDVTSIGDYAFYGCDNLTSITIPNSVTSIGYDAFYQCTALNRVDITSIEVWCNILFYNLFSNPLRYAYKLYLNDELVTDLILPDTATCIGKYAFYNCKSLTSIAISDSVTSIGNYAFDSCTSLTSVTIGDNVTSIGDWEFSNCTSLTSVIIGDNVTSIGNGAFARCKSLINITIPNSVTSVGYSAFLSCTSLRSIAIPDSVTSIGDSAFSDCTSLTDVCYTGNQEKWNDISIGSNNSCLTDATIYYNSTGIECETGYNFKYVENEDGTCYITDYIGQDKDIVIPEEINGMTVTGFGFHLISEETSYSNVTSISIPKTITDIDEKAFINFTSLKTITVDTKNTEFKSDNDILYTSNGTVLICYPANKSGELFTIPITVKYVENYAFYNCCNLNTLNATHTMQYGGDEIINKVNDDLTINLMSGTELHVNAVKYNINYKVVDIYDYSGTSFGFDLKEDGYSFINNRLSFSYPEDYKLPLSSFKSVYGDKYTQQQYESEGKWGGNCYGMSVTAAMFEKDLLDSDAYGSNTVNDLYDSYDFWNEIMKLSSNSKLTTLIEEYQIWQSSVEGVAVNNEINSQAQSYAGLFLKAIDIVNKTAEPLLVLVYWKEDNIGKGHALVIDTARKPLEMGNNWWRIYLYDPNYPYSNSKQSLNEAYDHCSERYVDVNVVNGQWRMSASVKTGASSVNIGYNTDGSYIDGSYIAFCSTENMTRNVDSGTAKFLPSEESSQTCVNVFSNDIIISDSFGNNVFYANNGSVEYISDEANFVQNIGYLDGENTGLSGKVYLPKGKYILKFDKKGKAQVLNADYFVGIVASDDSQIDVDSKGNVTSSSVVGSQNSIVIERIDDDTYTSVKTDIKYDDENSIELSLDQNDHYTVTNSNEITVDVVSSKTDDKEYRIENFDGDLSSCSDIAYIAKSVGTEVSPQCKHLNTTTQNAINASCISNGYTGDIVCVDCGEIVKYGESTLATGVHNYYQNTVAPTYEAQGYTEYTCTVCGYSYKDNYVSKLVKPSEPTTSAPDPTPQPTQPTTTTSPAQIATTSTTVKKPKSTSISKLKKGKKKFKVTWKKVSSISGYQIQYSTDKKFKKNNKNVTAKKSSTSATIKKLKSKKTYFVRIRTYKTVKINGKSTKVYSSWSKVKTVKTK